MSEELIMKVTFEINTDDDEFKAQRILEADTAFGLLYDINQLCWDVLKNDHLQLQSKDMLEEIRLRIGSSNLLDFYR
jgi:hypothetical protein